MEHFRATFGNVEKSDWPSEIALIGTKLYPHKDAWTMVSTITTTRKR